MFKGFMDLRLRGDDSVDWVPRASRGGLGEVAILQEIRHCERSEAIQESVGPFTVVDCRVALLLAMTGFGDPPFDTFAENRSPYSSMALTMSSQTFLASPKSIMVLSLKNSSFSTPA